MMYKLKIIHKTSTSLKDWLHTTLHQCLDCTATTSQYTCQVPWTRPHGVDPTRQVPQWLRWAVALGTSFVKSKHCFCASWTATELTRRWKKMIQAIFRYERKRRNMKKLWSPHKVTPYLPPPKPLTYLVPSRSHALLPWLWSGPNLGNSDFNRSVFPGFCCIQLSCPKLWKSSACPGSGGAPWASQLSLVTRSAERLSPLRMKASPSEISGVETRTSWMSCGQFEILILWSSYHVFPYYSLVIIIIIIIINIIIIIIINIIIIIIIIIIILLQKRNISR